MSRSVNATQLVSNGSPTAGESPSLSLRAASGSLFGTFPVTKSHCFGAVAIKGRQLRTSGSIRLPQHFCHSYGLVLQPAIHCGTAAPRRIGTAFEPIFLHSAGVGITLVSTSLQGTASHARDRRASRWGLKVQRELWRRRLCSSNHPTECDQQQGDNGLNSSVSHVRSTPLLRAVSTVNAIRSPDKLSYRKLTHRLVATNASTDLHLKGCFLRNTKFAI